MTFIDGENLVFRYQDTLKAGAIATSGVAHKPDVYIWHPNIATTVGFHPQRIYYYTSAVGDEDRITDIRTDISNMGYESTIGTYSRIIPFVFKKEGREKSRKVDIQICIDVLRHVLLDHIDLVTLVSGDGDFLPLNQRGRATREAGCCLCAEKRIAFRNSNKRG
jgi:uncharacterized LabA/DUF88 family protein